MEPGYPAYAQRFIQCLVAAIECCMVDGNALHPLYKNNSIAVIIPALNEEKSIGLVLAAIPDFVDRIIVIDNGSTDKTALVAAEWADTTLLEPQKGYGKACLTGLAAAGEEDITVFLDADFSDHPNEMARLIDPIIEDDRDLVIGSRVLGEPEKGALNLVQIWGNGLACFLIKLLWGYRYSDLGPFRAIRRKALDKIDMRDENFGWTVEMQAKAAAFKLKTLDVPVSYRKRIGVSKISGTLNGVIKAGTKIIWTIFYLRVATIGGYKIRKK